ncbi:MAG: hypothetical protein Tsb0017_23750 [Geothermobacteraceae bacterium]
MAAWLSWLSLLLWTVPWVPTSSIPAALVIGLLVFERQWLREQIASYRAEAVLLFLVLVLGIAFSQLPSKSLKGSYDFLRGAVFFFPVLYLAGQERERLKKGFWPTLCGGLVLLLAAAAWAWSEGNGSLRGFQKQLILSFRHYNVFATCVATVGVFAAAGALFGRSGKFSSWLGCLLLCISAILTFITGSRGSFVALLIVAALGCYLRFRNLRKWLLAGGSALIAVLVALVASGWLGEHVSAWHRRGDFTAGRLKLFGAIWDAVATQSPATGFGINTYKYLDIAQPLKKSVVLPHNVLLESLFSLGLVGTLALIILAVLLIRRLRTEPVDPMLYNVGLMLIVFYLLRGMLDMKLFSQYFPAALAFGYAMMTGAMIPARRRDG